MLFRTALRSMKADSFPILRTDRSTFLNNCSKTACQDHLFNPKTHFRAASSKGFVPAMTQYAVATHGDSKTVDKHQKSNPHISKLFSLEDRTVVVTGAGRGLGIVLTTAVLEAGGDVVCLDVLPKPSDQEWSHVQDTAKVNGGHVSYYQGDITDDHAIIQTLAEAGKEAQKRGKPIRGLISCAGIQHMKDAIDYPLENFRKILEVNVTGSFVVAKSTARLMREEGNTGSIVFIASMSGQIANRGIHCAAYNTSKAAVQQMSRSLATEWGEYGIRVNSLSPGYIRTAMTDMLLAEKPEIEKKWMAGALLGRLGVAEDFKSPAIYLLAEGSSFMTGADLRVDGGHCASA